MKTVATLWFQNFKERLSSYVVAAVLQPVDDAFRRLLDATGKAASRSTYDKALGDARKALLVLRANIPAAAIDSASHGGDDNPPDFAPLAGNQQMRDILNRRWQECIKCVRTDAHLASIVMMGGFLEALFVAQANKLTNKTPLINATTAPRDKASGKTLNYQEWTLDSYIKVAHELGWITQSAKDVADVLKEWRNYVHPEKELRHGVVLELNDSSMFWQVTKALARQLLLRAAGT
jgi:hypothetical protein